MVKSSFRNILSSFGHLVFPYNCAGCGTDILEPGEGICSQCISLLPVTGYLQQDTNAVEEIFRGRIHLEHAAACCFFTKKSRVQQLMHQVKYQFRKDAGRQLGRWMGYQLLKCPWYHEADLLLPMPLHHKRKLQRGYNQAELLCNGISEITGKPCLPETVYRQSATSSQTKQHREERWDNMRQAFGIKDENSLVNRHVLLVDDVVTTGATLEAMGRQLLQVPGLKLSICCFAYTLPH
ncbi:ComF family protein [Flavihumibacter stibioxidans]|uniref:Phosphoribosyltransferase domain-containing protein n=1 Tax=Flavihumibacter stibioxidans TaxID=1834163 RepID=A0ABR7M9F5_9BACT|nr:ComF family protein [Flavihumibacter stibioxidans]MBC6491659.1 hypothetical protein [Flavihumibacter stibioxidans]